MSRSRRDLDAKLTKKWLSSNAVREGVLTSLILTLEEAGESGDVERTVDQAAQEEFKRYQADEEYAPPETLRKVLEVLEQRLGFDRLTAEATQRHRSICEALLAKADQHSGYR